jgi:serine/threonine-protein kinase RsbW
VNEDVIRMSIPAKPDYILAVRLAVSAVAERMGFDIDDIEDIKVASSEGCILLLSYRPGSVEIGITVKPDGIGMDIGAVTPKGREEEPEEDLSQYLLEALVDECSFKRQGEMVTGVHLFKKRR